MRWANSCSGVSRQEGRWKRAGLEAEAARHDRDIEELRSREVPVAGDLLGAKAKAAAGADDDDPVNRIAELDNLRKSGAISDAEYQSAKAKLLSKI